MTKKREHPRFCDPSEFTQDKGKTNHGTTIYVRCLECGKRVWFDVAKRIGQCYSCQKLHKLHKQYKVWRDEDIFDAIGIDVSTYRRQVSREPEIIQPYPLSQRARDYIRSRGISQKTLLLFPVLQEVKHWERKWLCWQNVVGSYELREIFGSRSGVPGGSTKTYSRFDIRPGKKAVVCEALFDAMSYAQLHDYPADVYVALNSTSCVKDLIRDLPTWDIEHVILALDKDKAGIDATRELYRALSPTTNVTVDHPPTWGKDWNDILMENM